MSVDWDVLVGLIILFIIPVINYLGNWLCRICFVCSHSIFFIWVIGMSCLMNWFSVLDKLTLKMLNDSLSQWVS